MMCRLIYEKYNQYNFLLHVDGLMDEKEKELFNAVSRNMDEDIAAISDALHEFGLDDMEDRIREWYDGFTFGKKTDIYNPWSIINFLDEKKLSTNWANTSSNSLVSKLILEGNKDIKIIMEDLLNSGLLHTKMDEQIVFSQLDGRFIRQICNYIKSRKRIWTL